MSASQVSNFMFHSFLQLNMLTVLLFSEVEFFNINTHTHVCVFYVCTFSDLGDVYIVHS